LADLALYLSSNTLQARHSIVGGRKPEQLDDVLSAAKTLLTNRDLEEIEGFAKIACSQFDSTPSAQ